MRMVYFLATLTLAAAAAGAQQRAPGPAPTQGVAPGQRATAGEQKSPAAGEAGTAAPPVAGYVLTVLVSEKPAVREVKLEGNEEVSKDDFKETIEVKPFQILDQEAVRKSAKKMQEKYVEKGFFLAEVTPKIVPLPNNEVNVLFQINEHAKITVKEIRFVGNRALSDSELKDAMLTQEGGPFSFLTGAGTYREEAFQRDEIVLQGLYFDQGYIYVKFGKPAIELSPDKRYIFITMTIDEGEPFDVDGHEIGRAHV